MKMTPEQIGDADAKLAAMNEQDKQLRMQILQAESDLADAQTAAEKAVANVRSCGNKRDTLVARRNLLKAQYGELYEEVGQAKKLAAVEAEAKPKA